MNVRLKIRIIKLILRGLAILVWRAKMDLNDGVLKDRWRSYISDVDDVNREIDRLEMILEKTE